MQQVCASLENFKATTVSHSSEVVHTSFAGAWHAHFCNGGDDGVVRIAFANQVDYPICDLFNGAPVQAMILSRLEMPEKSQSI